MSVKMKPSDFYSKRKYLIKLDRYKSNDENLNKKLDIIQTHLDNGFTLYSTRIMGRFLLGYHDIHDFAMQFILLDNYNLNHEVLFLNNYKTIQDAYNKEQFILSVFNNNRVTTDYKGFYTTESFNIGVLKGFYEII